MDKLQREFIEKIVKKVFNTDEFVFDEYSFAGGLTNKNYKISVKGKDYIFRVPGACTEIMINRKEEEINNQKASDFGFNAKCIYFNSETGVKITEFIKNAQTLNSKTCRTRENLKLVANILKNLHNSDIGFKNKFDYIVELSKYEELVIDKSYFNYYDSYEEMKNKFLISFENFKEKNKLDLKSCHNDCVCENFIRSDDKIYLVDWEYSGINDPAWEFASYIIENRLTSEESECLLSEYYGEDIPYNKIEVLQIFQDLLWAVWSIAKCCKGEDYLEYGIDRYNRFVDNYKNCKYLIYK